MHEAVDERPKVPVLAHFGDGNGGLYDTADDAEQLVRRPQDPTDSATPSGSSAQSKSIFGLTITGGILGTFSINNSGDTNLLPITIYRQQGKDLVPVTTITVPESLTK